MGAPKLFAHLRKHKRKSRATKENQLYTKCSKSRTQDKYTLHKFGRRLASRISMHAKEMACWVPICGSCMQAVLRGARTALTP